MQDSPVPTTMTASGFLNLVGALGVHADSVSSVSFNIWLFQLFFGLVFFLFGFRSVATISVVLLCVYSFEFCAFWFSNLLSQESTHLVGHDGLFSLRVLCPALILIVWRK